MTEVDDRHLSLAERAEKGEGSEPMEELFPMGSVHGDQGVTIKTLIKAGLTNEFTMAMRSGEVPVRQEGMLHPDRQAKLLVTVEPGKVEIVPVREGDGGEKRLVGWKTRQSLRPVHFQRIDGDAGEIQANFAVLADSDPGQAGQLLEQLQRMMRENLS